MELFKNIQPGMSVILKGEIERLVYAAKLENIVFNLGNHYYTHLMGEFYCNMRIGKSLDGVLHFTTVVDGRLMLVDHKTINRALDLSLKLTTMPCLDIYSYFTFKKNEFQLMVSNFCNADVPPVIRDTNCGIHFKHFNPKVQLLDLIIRANILPKPNQSNYFDFLDMKVMFAILTNQINFSIGGIC